MLAGNFVIFQGVLIPCSTFGSAHGFVYFIDYFGEICSVLYDLVSFTTSDRNLIIIA